MDCPICQNNANFKFESHFNKRVFLCSNFKCHHLFVENYEKDTGICDRGEDVSIKKLKIDRNIRLATYGERNKKMFEVMFRKLQLKRDVKVLDFGSGDGNVMSSLREFCPEANITCIEPHSVFMPILQEIADNIVPSAIELNERFDLIVLNEVIEHLNYPIDCLTQLSSLLKEARSGIYIATPLGETHLNSNLTGAYTTDSHLHFFTRSSLNMCLYKSGLTALDVDDINYPIYSTLLDKSIKGRVKYATKKLLINSLLKLNEKYCILPAVHVSGLCYKQ